MKIIFQMEIYYAAPNARVKKKGAGIRELERLKDRDGEMEKMGYAKQITTPCFSRPTALFSRAVLQ
jgi:hypothetical protein